VRELWSPVRVTKFVNRPKLFGMVPVNRLSAKLKNVKAVKFPTVDGTVLDIRLSPMSRYVRDDSPPILIGKVPERVLDEKSIFDT